MVIHLLDNIQQEKEYIDDLALELELVDEGSEVECLDSLHFLEFVKTYLNAEQDTEAHT